MHSQCLYDNSFRAHYTQTKCVTMRIAYCFSRILWMKKFFYPNIRTSTRKVSSYKSYVNWSSIHSEAPPIENNVWFELQLKGFTQECLNVRRQTMPNFIHKHSTYMWKPNDWKRKRKIWKFLIICSEMQTIYFMGIITILSHLICCIEF